MEIYLVWLEELYKNLLPEMLDLHINPQKTNQISSKLKSIICDIKCLNEADDLPCLIDKPNLLFLISKSTKNSNQCVKENKIKKTLQIFYISYFSQRLRFIIVKLKPMVCQLCCFQVEKKC